MTIPPRAARRARSSWPAYVSIAALVLLAATTLATTMLAMTQRSASATTGAWALAGTTPAATYLGEAPLPATNSSNEPPNPSPQVKLNDAVCVGTSLCIAVGVYKDNGSGFYGLIDTSLDGTWSASVAPEPLDAGSDTGADADARLNAVSCTSATSCIAVGYYEDATGYFHGLIETLSGGAWTATTAPAPPANVYGSLELTSGTSPTNYALAAVSCFAVGSCTAVGEYTDTAGGQFAVVDTLAGGTWSALPAPEPLTNASGEVQAADASSVAGLSTVDCAAAGSCTAVGSYNDALGFVYGLIDTASGGSWTAVAAPEPTSNVTSSPDLPGTDADNNENATLSAVTCSTPTSCVAVGLYRDDYMHNIVAGNVSYEYGLIDTLAAGTWTAVAAPRPSDARTDADSNSNSSLTAISCPSQTSCVAVGNYNDTTLSGYYFGLVDTLSGGAWTASQAAYPTAAATDPNVSFSSIECASTTSCTVVGQYLDPSSHVYGFIDTLTGATSSAITAVVPSNATGTFADPTTVSCSSEGVCILVGEYADGGGGPVQGLIDGYLTPPSAPSAPTNVSATAAGSAVDVSWDAPASDGDSPITSYLITPYLGGVAQSPVSVPPGDTSYEVTGLTGGAAYTFTVEALNIAGPSPASPASTSITPPTTTTTTAAPPTTTAAPTTTTTSAATTAVAPATTTSLPVVPPRIVTRLLTLGYRHGAITVATTCQRASCRGSANVTVARYVKSSAAWVHLVLAKTTFDLRKGEHATLHLKITAVGRRVLNIHEKFWLNTTSHYRMTLTTRTDGAATTHHSVNLR